MRARHLITGLAVVALGATAATAHAEALTISLDRVVFGAPGDVVQLVTRPIDAAMVGFVCTADYRGQNNGSVHPGTDLLVASAGSQLVLAGLEDDADGATTGSGSLVLGSDVVISVRLGGDGVASMGATLSLACAPPAATTTTSTTAAPAVSTTAPPTSSPTTTVATDAGTVTTVAAAGEPATTTTSTTVVVAAAGPTVAPADAVPTPTTPSSATPRNPVLPATGSSSDQLTSVALAAVLAGSLLCLSRRRGAPVAGR